MVTLIERPRFAVGFQWEGNAEKAEAFLEQPKHLLNEKRNDKFRWFINNKKLFLLMGTRIYGTVPLGDWVVRNNNNEFNALAQLELDQFYTIKP